MQIKQLKNTKQTKKIIKNIKQPKKIIKNTKQTKKINQLKNTKQLKNKITNTPYYVNITKTIFDIINREDVVIADFIGETFDNIIIKHNIINDSSNYNQCIMINKNDLKNQLNFGTIYKCKDSVPLNSIDIRPTDIDNTPYFNLKLVGLPFDAIIPVKFIQDTLIPSSYSQLYVIESSKSIFERVASHDMVYGSQNAVSSNHCQANTNISIYDIYPAIPSIKD